MAGEFVVYVHHIKCPSCGLESPGYLRALGDGRGVTACPRCGTRITRELPQHYVPQIPPPSFEAPGHPHIRMSHYPGLYMQPKHAPRLDFVDLIRIGYSPTRAFTSLYLSTNLQRALALVVIFSIVSTVVSTLITADMAEVLGYGAADALELAFQGFVSWIVSLFAFLIFGTAAAVVAKEIFGGRGEKSSTIALLGYCYPSYVVLSIVLLVIFSVGFQGLDLTQAKEWTDAELNQAIVGGTLLLAVALIGVIWLITITSRAVSVANDISMGEGALSAILAVILAGIVYLLAGMVMRLPLGLSF